MALEKIQIVTRKKLISKANALYHTSIPQINMQFVQKILMLKSVVLVNNGVVLVNNSVVPR